MLTKRFSDRAPLQLLMRWMRLPRSTYYYKAHPGMFAEKLKSTYAANIPKDAMTLFEKIDTSVSRLSEIIDGILAFASVKSENVTDEKVDLIEVIESIQRDHYRREESQNQICAASYNSRLTVLDLSTVL